MTPFDAVFLVDDDPINNLINRRLLGKVPLTSKIEEFLSGQEALERLSELNQDSRLLIFLDINMPVLNGWEFLDQYISLYPGRKDHILVLSSSIDFQDRQRAKEYEVVSGFIEKPLTLQKISQSLEIA